MVPARKGPVDEAPHVLRAVPCLFPHVQNLDVGRENMFLNPGGIDERHAVFLFAIVTVVAMAIR